MLKANEKSDRAFELTKDAALLNPANYSVWYYRRILIKELNKDLNEELEFITNVIRSHPKNYQVWEHRKNVVDLLQDPSQELFFTQQIIKKDSKNYHAWQYRQWVIKNFALWSNELDYIDELLDQDIRNNSAWNQRYFYLSNRNNLNSADSVKVLNEEIEFCLNKIDLCIDNESSWNYLRAIVNNLISLSAVEGGEFFYPQKVIEFCSRKMITDKEDERSPFLLSFVVEYNSARVKHLMGKLKQNLGNSDGIKSEIKGLVKKSIEILESLGTRYDTIRVNYWNYLISKLRQEYSDYV